MKKYYQSPVSGELWTKQQWEQYVLWEESRMAEDRKHDCDDCQGCEKCSQSN